MMLTVADVGEEGVLRRLRQRLARSSTRRGIPLDIGDDAALLRRLAPLATLTTDMLVENVDFCRSWATAADIGHKAAAVNLSDLAAMGARPRGLLAAVALRADARVDDILTMLVTMDRLGRRFGAPLVGGDLSRIDGPWVVSVTAVGEVSQRGALRRGVARVHDVVLISGALGGAAAGLAGLVAGRAVSPRWCRRQLRPEPRVRLGLALSRWGRVRACADISDGLAKDIMHLPVPGCGVEVHVDSLPLQAGLKRLPYAEALRYGLYGGEDFELVLAVPPRQVDEVQRIGQAAGVRLSAVGRVVKSAGLHFTGRGAGELGGHGYDHFR